VRRAPTLAASSTLATVVAALAALGPLAALATLSPACGSGARPVRGTSASGPASIEVAPPAASQASPIATGPADAAAAAPGDGVFPLEVAFDRSEIYARVAGRIHHANDLSGDRALTSFPVVDGVEDAISLAVGRNFGCAVTRAGEVRCWGDNTWGQLGARLRDDQSPRAVAVAGVSGARRVVAAERHACALLVDGRVACWGSNELGQTGSSTSHLPPAHELVQAEPVARLTGATALAASDSSTCAVAGDQTWCWGLRVLASDTADPRVPLRPAALRALAGFTDVSGSERSFCGVRAGEVLCWGELYSLFAGGGGARSTPTSAGLRRATRVRLGSHHACALLSDGSVSCFGTDDGHALGRPPRATDGPGGGPSGIGPHAPEVVRGLPAGAVDVAAGGSMSCAVTSARDLYCWGTWLHSGIGGMRVEPTPVKVRVFD